MAVAVACAAVVSAVAWRHVGDRLALKTDIVGYTTFGDIDVYHLLDHFYILAFLLPGLGAALYLLIASRGPLASRIPRSGWPPTLIREAIAPRSPQLVSESGRPIASAPQPAQASARRSVGAIPAIGIAARLLLPALVVAAELEIGRSSRAQTVSLPLGAAAVLAYLGVVAAVAIPLQRRQGRGASAWSAANAVLATAVVPLLLLVSSSTTVFVASTHRVVHYPWLPVWLALGATLVILALIAIGLRRGGWEAARRAERLVLTVVAGPVALFLVTAVLLGAQGKFIGYDDAMAMTGAQLVFGHGLWPWKDIFLLHGFLSDALYGQLGMWVFGTTVWGSNSGYSFLVEPLTVISLYAFIVYFARRNCALLLAGCLAVVLGVLVSWPGTRFVLVPPLFILFDLVLRRDSWGRCWAFMAVLVIAAIITPETSLLVLGILATLVLSDLVHHRWGEPLRRGLRRTLRCGVAGASLAAGWVVILLVTGSLSSFVSFYLAIASGHELWGALPIAVPFASASLNAEFFLPVVLFVLTVASVVWRLQRGAPWRTVEWVLVASATFVPIYYQEALDRLDLGHVDVLFQALTPMVILCAYELVTAIDRWLPRAVSGSRSRISRSRAMPAGRPRRGTGGAWPWTAVTPAALVTLICVVAFSPQSLSTWANLPGNFHPSVPIEAPVGLPLGYTEPGAVDTTQLTDLAAVLDRYAGPTAPVFDFTNEPGVTFFLLDRVPAAPFYHVGAAQTVGAQQLEVAALKRSRPPVVIFTDVTFGLPDYDGIWSMERDFLISQYILDNYQPTVDVQGQIIMLRDDLVSTAPALPSLAVPPITTGLYFAGEPSCDWGDVPDFLDPPAPSEIAAGVPVTTALVNGEAIAGGATLLSMSMPGSGALGAYQWLEFQSPDGFGQATIEVTDQTLGAQPSHLITFHALPQVGDTVYLRVGSCIQWHGYDAGDLHLVVQRGPADMSVRVLP